MNAGYLGKLSELSPRHEVRERIGATGLEADWIGDRASGMRRFWRWNLWWIFWSVLSLISSPVLAAPEILVCQVGNSADVAPEVIKVDDADQSVNIVNGSVGGQITVTRYDADAIAFKDSFVNGDKLLMQINRATGRFTFEYENTEGQMVGSVAVGQCTKGGQQF